MNNFTTEAQRHRESLTEKDPRTGRSLLPPLRFIEILGLDCWSLPMRSVFVTNCTFVG